MGPKAVKTSEYSSMEVVSTCEIRAPVKKYIPRVPHNKLLRLSMIDCSSLLIHRKCFRDGVYHPGNTLRMHSKLLRKCSAVSLNSERSNTVSVFLHCSVFIGDKIHPVSGRRDKADVGHGIQ